MEVIVWELPCVTVKQGKLSVVLLSAGISDPLVKLLAPFSTCGTFSSLVINVGDDLHKATNNSLLEITLLTHNSVRDVSSRQEQFGSLRAWLPFWD